MGTLASDHSSATGAVVRWAYVPVGLSVASPVGHWSIAVKGCSRNDHCTAHKGTQKIVPLRPMRPSRYTGWTRERSASTLEGAPRSRHAATLSRCLALDAELDSTSGREPRVRAPGRPWLMALRSRATAEHVPLDVHQSPHAEVRPCRSGATLGQGPSVTPTTTLKSARSFTPLFTHTLTDRTRCGG